MVELPAATEGVDIAKLLALLGARDVTSVLAEGGATLLGSLFDAGLVDKVVAFIAPLIVGGAEARSAVGGAGADSVAAALRLDRVRYEQTGDDMMVVGYLPR